MYVIRTIIDIVYISHNILTYGVIIRSDKEWNNSSFLFKWTTLVIIDITGKGGIFC